MDFLSDFANALWEKVNDILTWLLDLLSLIFDALWLFFGDVLAWSFDGILSIVIGATDSIDLSGLSGYSSAWADLPDEVTNALGLLGIGQASAIIISAVTVRLTLQLTPFVRLGS